MVMNILKNSDVPALSGAVAVVGLPAAALEV